MDTIIGGISFDGVAQVGIRFELIIQKVGLSRCRLQLDSYHTEQLLAVARLTLPSGQLVLRARIPGEQGSNARDFDVDLTQNFIDLNFNLVYYFNRI